LAIEKISFTRIKQGFPRLVRPGTRYSRPLKRATQISPVNTTRESKMRIVKGKTDWSNAKNQNP
jgi:hypothetical protein